MVALGISALALPLALHYWTFDQTQRIATLIFYGIDWALLLLNASVDFITRTNGSLPDWAHGYMQWGVPAAPLVAGMGWALVWMLDPSQRERAMIEQLKTSTRTLLAVRVTEVAANTDVTAKVDTAAATLVDDIVTATLGASVGQKAVESKSQANRQREEQARLQRELDTFYAWQEQQRLLAETGEWPAIEPTADASSGNGSNP